MHPSDFDICAVVNNRKKTNSCAGIRSSMTFRRVCPDLEDTSPTDLYAAERVAAPGKCGSQRDREQ